MTKCIIENCHYQQAAALDCGLCMRCYSAAKKQVDAGTITWDELVALGLALPKGSSDPFTTELNKKLEGK